MSLVEFLVQGAQPDYMPQVESIARSWEAMLGPNALQPLDNESFVDLVIDKIESGTVAESVQVQLVSDLLSLSWWRGFNISDSNAGRLFRCANQHFAALCNSITFDPWTLSAKQCRQHHHVFVGTLQDPLHSPSSAAIDYVAALALDDRSKSINIYFAGEITNRMQSFIDKRLGKFYNKKTIKFVNNTNDSALIINLYNSHPGCIHFMCEPNISPIISVLNFVGPTVMFNCNDEIPMQYSDVYWYTHKTSYIHELWARRQAPRNIIANYIQIDAGANAINLDPTPKCRKDYGIESGSFLIATVGNRLGQDLDEAFVTGIELTLKSHPNAIWMVVGELPQNLLYACSQVFGQQFRYVPFEPELDQLMAMADVFANPFRPGGGSSAFIAMGAKCVLLSLNTGGVASMVPEEHLALSVDDYFDRLCLLIEDANAYSAWKSVQSARVREIADPEAFARSLYEAVEIAHSRYQSRRGKSLNEMIFGNQSIDPRSQTAAA